MSAIATSLAESLISIPPQLATLIVAAIPIAELRGAIPVAIGIYDLPIWQAALWSIIGNMLPVYFLLIFFERISTWLSARSEVAAHMLDKMYERTRRKLEVPVQKYGPWALALFVAVPLPITGAWTGTLAAFVFGLPKKKAFLAIFVGVLIASVVVTLLTVGTRATYQAIQ